MAEIKADLFHAVTAIANAITESAKILKDFLSGKELRRLKYQLEAAHHYIFVDEKSGEFKDISEEKVKDLKVHYKRRAFDAI